VVGSEKFTLKVGEYSEWIPAEFKAGMGFTAHGICRFYLKELSPEVEVYVTPVNIDPGHPDLPISHPVTYSIYLAKLFRAVCDARPGGRHVGAQRACAR
jgi:hypothetical protein